MPKKKRTCRKGYDCGLACISVTYVCRKDFPEGISISIDGMRTVIKNKLAEEEETMTIPMDQTPTMELEVTPKPEPISQALMDENGKFHTVEPDFDFNDLKQKEVLGSGVYGSAILTDENPPRIIKNGMLGESEIDALQTANQLGIGPKVYAAQYDMSEKETSEMFNLSFAPGKVLMDRVEGTMISKGPNKVPEETLKKIVEARAKLHKAGYAHNDMHGSNVLMDKQGNIKLIDMGLATKSPVSSLLEAIGNDSAFDRILEHDDNGIVSRKLHDAKQKITKQMMDDGMPRDLAMAMRITKPIKYKEVMEKAEALGWDMSPADVNKYIDMFYTEVGI